MSHSIEEKTVVNDEQPISEESNEQEKSSAPRFDAQEYIGICEDDIVDYDTAEEFLLHFSRVGNLNFVNKLLHLRKTNEIPLDINCKGESKANLGWSPLHLAAYFGHQDVVKSLLIHGAEVDIQNEEGDTPVHKAAYTGRDEIVVMLVAHNANVFICNGDGLRPFELAKTESIRQILFAAEKSDIKRREVRFLSAARTGDLNTMKSLLENVVSPVDINCVDQSGNTALHCAAYRGKSETVVFLLKQGIDTTVKNNHGQLAANLAPTISLKQLIQDVHLSVMTPQMIASLKSKAVSRFEGALLRKGRFFGWKPIWTVLERGVFSFYASRADAASGIRRKGYKYLEGAIAEPVNRPEHMGHHVFTIIFGDRSRALFSLLKNQTELDLQKWLNALNDHIYFGTNFIKQGTNVGDSDDEDEAAKLLPMSSIHDMILTASAHQKILEKHIGGLQQLMDDESLFCERYGEEVTAESSSLRSVPQLDSLSSSLVPSIKFHLSLILESSRNANSSLTQCLTVISHQNEARQRIIRQEQEKVRVLEEALQVLAREHHDLERSIICNSISMQQQQSVAETSGHMIRSTEEGHRLQSISSRLCLSDTATDIDEYFDAFDDEDDLDMPDQALTEGSPTDNDFGSALCDQLLANKVSDNCLAAGSTTFHTAAEENILEDVTLAESISTLSPDDEQDQTLSSLTLSLSRDRLPAPMVPRDEVGLWSILKHCIGKELSKITIPVIFNEPLSFLQRMAESFQYCEYLNIANQCENVVERMENICAFIISAYSSNWLRLNKPFNPLLGETFEFEIPSAKTRVVLEQVSHHPPISAWYAESSHFILRGSIHPKLRFWGKSIEVKPEGSLFLELKSTGELYTWKSINCCVHNIIVGKLWFEQYGTIEVYNHSNHYKIALNFKQAGWFGYDLNRFDGFIINERKEKIRFLYGKWNDYLKSSSVEDYQDYLKANNHKFRAPDKPVDDIGNSHSTPRKMMSKLNSLTKQLTGSGGSFDMSGDSMESDSKHFLHDTPSGEMPKSDSSHSLDISNSRILWKVSPRPENSEKYYHYNSFTFQLNELPKQKEILDTFPITDSRFRPDIRKLEEGDLDGAAAEKHRLEEKQRETRRLMKKRKEEFEPLWFRKQLNAFTKEDEWIFNNDYFKRDWSHCPDIF